MNDTEDTPATDPIALTLVVWLGLIVTVTGIGRLSQEASARAAMAQAARPPTSIGASLDSAAEDQHPMALRLVAFGS